MTATNNETAILIEETGPDWEPDASMRFYAQRGDWKFAFGATESEALANLLRSEREAAVTLTPAVDATTSKSQPASAPVAEQGSSSGNLPIEALERGLTRHVYATSDGPELDLYVSPDADLDDVVVGYDVEEGELVRVKGWLFCFEDYSDLR